MIRDSASQRCAANNCNKRPQGAHAFCEPLEGDCGVIYANTDDVLRSSLRCFRTTLNVSETRTVSDGGDVDSSAFLCVVILVIIPHIESISVTPVRVTSRHHNQPKVTRCPEQRTWQCVPSLKATTRLACLPS